MTLKNCLLRVTHLLFVILLLVQLLPDRSTKDVFTGALIAFAVGLELVTLGLSFLIRKKESLNLYLVANPRTPIDRQHNKETLLLAKKLRQEKEQELF